MDVYNPVKNEWDKIPAMLQVGCSPTYWMLFSVKKWLNLLLGSRILVRL